MRFRFGQPRGGTPLTFTLARTETSPVMTTIDLDVRFRPIVDTDVPLLHEWLQRAHVAEWWGGGAVCEHLEDTRRQYLPRLDDTSAVKGYFALLHGEPIGFIQSYVALGCGNGWWEDETDPGVRGIDQFLGDGSKPWTRSWVSNGNGIRSKTL
jgi:hypothetical protein